MIREGGARRIRCGGVAVLLCASAAAHAQGADKQPTVEKCSRELGTLAVAEPQQQMLTGLSRYGLGSPAAMLRLLVQDSGCFAVVERGAAMQNLAQERSLAAGGQLQAGSNIGGGQLQVADFVMTPSVLFSGDTGGAGAALGNVLGRMGPIGGLVGGVKFKEAETSLLVADVRSGIQVAAAEGKASRMDFSLGGWGWGGLGWASAGGYSKTPEGKLIAASLLDNYNRIVQSIRTRPQLIRSTSQASQQNAAQSIPATPMAGDPTAPPAMAAPAVGAAMPPGLFGAFSGQYGGNDQGTIMIVIGNNGEVSGVGQSAAQGNLSISGVVSNSGAFTLSATNASRSATTQFQGFINPTTGQLVGTWQSQNGRGQGTVSGKRQ